MIQKAAAIRRGCRRRGIGADRFGGPARQGAGIALVAIARNDGFEVSRTRSDILSEAPAHVA